MSSSETSTQHSGATGFGQLVKERSVADRYLDLWSGCARMRAVV
jgi:hypothetical protein